MARGAGPCSPTQDLADKYIYPHSPPMCASFYVLMVGSRKREQYPNSSASRLDGDWRRVLRILPWELKVKRKKMTVEGCTELRDNVHADAAPFPMEWSVPTLFFSFSVTVLSQS